MANAREVLARLERYELDVFAEEDQITEQKLRLYYRERPGCIGQKRERRKFGFV